jgi:predicted GTPase
MADIAIINKVNTASLAQVELVRKNIERHAPRAGIVLAESPVLVSTPEQIKGKRVLVVEDGPTLTHGGMPYGAGFIAAKTYSAVEVVDPRPYAKGTIREAYLLYPHTGPVLPAMGYSTDQVRDLEGTINDVDCDLVLFATPIQLTRILSINKPTIRVRYEYQDHDHPFLEEMLLDRLRARAHLDPARREATP